MEMVEIPFYRLADFAMKDQIVKILDFMGLISHMSSTAVVVWIQPQAI